MRTLLTALLSLGLAACSGGLSADSVLDTHCVAGVACGIPDGFAFAGETIWGFGASAIRPLAVRRDGDWSWSEDCGKNGFAMQVVTRGEEAWLWCDQGGARSIVRRAADGQTTTVEFADAIYAMLQLVDDFAVVGSEGLWGFNGTAFEKFAPLPETYDVYFGGGGQSRSSLYYGYFHWNGTAWQQLDPYPNRGDSPSVGGRPLVVDGKLCLGGRHLLDGTHWTDPFAGNAAGNPIGSPDCKTYFYWEADDAGEKFTVWKKVSGGEPQSLGEVPEALVRDNGGARPYPVLQGTFVDASLLLIPDDEHLYELELE